MASRTNWFILMPNSAAVIFKARCSPCSNWSGKRLIMCSPYGRMLITVNSIPLNVMQRKAFLYRLYPSQPQERLLDATLETCRHFYNDCLSERKTAYEERGDTIGTYDQLRHVKERKATNPWA